MTMHLVKGMSSLNTRKSKTKVTKSQRVQWEVDWRADTKWKRRQNLPVMTFEEYAAYRSGKVKKEKPVFQPLTTNNTSTTLEDHRKLYPSQEMSSHIPVKKESPVYSGERKLLGIATMHKSNMVPVFSAEEAVDLARMRRG